VEHRQGSDKEFTWGFDEAYAAMPCVFGRAADQFLAVNLQFAPRGKVLDLGCGEGRNGLYVAQEGFEVVGIDKSREGLKKMRRFAAEYGLSERVETIFGDFCHMDLGTETCTLIISAYALVFCRRMEQLTAIGRIKRALRPGGCVYISGLTTDDPDYERRKRSEPEIEPQTFKIEGSTAEEVCYQRWFSPGELRGMFLDFEVLDYREVMVRFERPPLERAMCLLFAKKPTIITHLRAEQYKAVQAL